MEVLRCFLALTLDEHARAQMEQVQGQLADRGVRVRWESNDKVHVTVRFLGDTTEKRRSDLEAALSPWASGSAPMDLVFNALGAFPSSERPRVIWAGAFPTDILMACGQEVEELCRSAGFPAELRPFHPHCTLARVRERDDVHALTKAIERITFDPILVRASELVLMRSVLLPGGSQYRALASFPLNRSRSIP
ncbi:MAG: RNA 2',3'-cyclic phosphodiesterase [Bacteroidota bacterium]